jgi:iron complex outermembrane recepter protein
VGGLRLHHEQVNYDFWDRVHNIYYGSPRCSAKSPTLPISTCNSDTVVTYKTALEYHLNHRVTWNLTGFYEVFTGFQAQTRDEVTGQNELESIGKVTSSGVETEFAARRLSQLTVSANGSYDIAKMVTFPIGPCYVGQTAALGCTNNLQDLSGKPLPNAPKWSGNINSQYDIPIVSGNSAFVALAYRWQSQVIFSLLRDPDSVQTTYGVFNLSTGLEGAQWKAMLFVNNLFNDVYALNRGRSSAYNLNRTVVPYTDAITWTPARDSFRYEGIRFSVSF